MAHNLEQHELLHIRNMVLQLERLVQSGNTVGLGIPVMQPEYWRNRINALLDTPVISRSAVTQASVLLMKLEIIADALKNGK
ncbi:hypothetical protein [Paraburkholderia aromaticivorans]|uniref:hypothetical protein n=1 Tax=Paraburkholderia aromaticivorans TaxID=2026199 RepID=UPI001455F95D|nr:hypothetical protein [Paraburkholderia aromaticivorans]